MNKTAIVLILFLLWNPLSISETFAQDCLSDEPNSPSCNGIISTDPSAPINSTRPEMKNKFNWMSDYFNVYHPSGGYWGGTNVPFQITNPFYTADSYLSNINYFNFLFADRIPENLDFYPKDGWQLIHKGNGYALNESTLLATSDNRVGPYFILYNKYTGTIRTFAAFSNIGINETMLTIIKYKKTNSLNYSALLNKYESAIAPLDQPTNVSQVVQGSNATIAGQFFSADFRTNYDPCVCNYSSSLNFDFKVKNTGAINLSGRLIGTSVPLDGSGNSPLLNGRDFLNAVNVQEFSVKGGMLTYNNIDRLVEKYKTPETDFFTELALNSLKSALGALGKPFEDILDKPASALLTKSFGGATIFGTTLKDTLTVSLGAVGAATGYLAAQIGSGKKIPNISFIEAEMALSGTVGYNFNLGAGSIEIAQPGSLGTENSAITPAKYYPAYNEALGLMAVFNKPQVKTYSGTRNVVVDNQIGTKRYYQIQFEPTSLKYFFNPAAEVNVPASRLYGAIEIKVPSSWIYKNVIGANFIASANGYSTYVTDFLPIESLYRARPSIELDCFTDFCEPPRDFNDVIVNFKFQVFYEFLANSYGKVNRFWEVLTYPIQRITSSTQLVDKTADKPQPFINITDIGPVYSSSGAIKSLGGIYIQDNLAVNSGVSFEYISGTQVTLAANSSLPAGLSLKAYPFDNAYDDVKLSQVSSAYVKSFCSSGGQYLSKNSTPAAARAESEDTPSVEELPNFNEIFHLTIFPNPSNQFTKIDYSIPNDGIVRIELMSLSGQQVRVVVDDFQQFGNYGIDLNTTDLPGGLYIVIFKWGGYQKFDKLLVAH